MCIQCSSKDVCLRDNRCVLLMTVAQVADHAAGLVDGLSSGWVGGGSGQSARSLQHCHCRHHLESAYQSGDRSQRQRYGLHSDGRCDHGTFSFLFKRQTLLSNVFRRNNCKWSSERPLQPKVETWSSLPSFFPILTIILLYYRNFTASPWWLRWQPVNPGPLVPPQPVDQTRLSELCSNKFILESEDLWTWSECCTTTLHNLTHIFSCWLQRERPLSKFC